MPKLVNWGAAGKEPANWIIVVLMLLIGVFRSKADHRLGLGLKFPCRSIAAVGPALTRNSAP